MRLIDSMPPDSTGSDWPKLNRLGAERDGLQARRARLIDGLGRHAVRQAGAPDDLPSRVRSGTGLAPVADEDFVDRIGRDAGARERGARRARAELGGMRVTQACRRSGR